MAPFFLFLRDEFELFFFHFFMFRFSFGFYFQLLDTIGTFKTFLPKNIHLNFFHVLEF